MQFMPGDGSGSLRPISPLLTPDRRYRMRADALLFDLDGVLVDSAECVRRVCTDWAISRGLDPASVLRVSQGRRVQDTIRAVAPHLDVDTEAEMLVALEARSTDG